MFGTTGGAGGTAGGTPFLPPSTSASISFGAPTANTNLFGATTVNQPTATSTTSLFGTAPAPTFGAPTANPSAVTPAFGAALATNPTFGTGTAAAIPSFGSATSTASTAPAFGTGTTTNPSFGATIPSAAPISNLTPFGAGAATSGTTAPTTTATNPISLGTLTSLATTTSAAGTLFSAAPAPTTAALFSGAASAAPTTAAPLFPSTTATSSAASLFPSTPGAAATSGSGLGLTTASLPKTSAQSLFSLNATPASTASTGLGMSLTAPAPVATGMPGESTAEPGKIADMNSLEGQIHKLIRHTERHGIAFREMVRDVNSLDTVIRSNSDKLREGKDRFEAFDKRATNLDYGIAFVNDQLSNLEDGLNSMEKQLRLPAWTGDWSGKGAFGETNIRTAADEKRRLILQLLLSLDATLKNTTYEANNAQRDVSSLALQMQGGQKEDEKALALILYKHLDMLNWIDKMNDDIEKKLTTLERNL
ncbi:unnamed protein product, partial [Mesorhabditis belari]|uniref:Nucleoporin NSP1-like C-terminal domain-containing protein n=1 Tax=Mesorhabditis belari TaxID=2138241 RepID=A0AAF3F1A2_9BILA